MTMQTLFRRDPTRQLEEVQKVNARQRAETDVEEFYETESAKAVLTQLGSIVEKHPTESARFLYVYATFGSGKTHLLKLLGLVADRDSPFSHLGTTLASQWSGFDNLSQSIERSQHTDRLIPIFLNLLNRDASKEPPLPFLIFEAIGRERGYPTDPNWLLEWSWSVDMEYDSVWDAIQEATHDGQTFSDVVSDRASLRRWLYEVLPTLPEARGTELATKDGVKASIEQAVEDISPSEFDAVQLVARIETLTTILNETESGKSTELLLGLDEVALFIGDSKQRYREFEETMEALQHGPNPVVITTGQYSLPKTRQSLLGSYTDEHWTSNQVRLGGADTEIIVRKRWLQKNASGSDTVESLLEALPDLTLNTQEEIAQMDSNSIESYPFRSYDLTLLRSVMQQLITQGRATDREYIQGRALLVLVRSLFTKFEWASKEPGALVTWDEMFDLLVEETTYVPLWVQEMIDNTLVPTFDGDEDAWEIRVAKALYLVNQLPSVPATPDNLGRLLFDQVDQSLSERVEETKDGLQALVRKKKALEETSESGEIVYTLVSEEQENILKRAEAKAEEISPYQLSAWLETRLRDADRFFRSDGTLHEQSVGNERYVPLRYAYSILDTVDRAPKTVFDSLRIRVLAVTDETLESQIETWQNVNRDRPGGEHILIAMEVEGGTVGRIKSVIGMQQVLDDEVESHDELLREHRTNKRRLEATINTLLDTATVYTPTASHGTRPAAIEQVVSEQLTSVFGNRRKVLSRPLVEVDDAKTMARFFRGGDTWPLSTEDAALFGVDIESGTLSKSGWCQEFIDRYESHTAVDVETLLQQTSTANGAYRGTPQESIAALLIILATSNEKIALKRDTEYVTEPVNIGRVVRTKGGLTSLQVRFGVDTINPKEIRSVIETLISGSLSGDDPDEWVNTLGQWVSEHSVALKRTFKRISREFGTPLSALEDALSPGYSDKPIEAEPLVTDAVKNEAEIFSRAYELFTATNGQSLWDQFEETQTLMEERYPTATVTSRINKTASGSTVPTTETIESRIADARRHRVDTLLTHYRQLTGTQPDVETPDEICAAFSVWISDERSAIEDLIETGTQAFDGVSLDSISALCQSVWNGETLTEAMIVDTLVQQELEMYASIRAVCDGTDSLWKQLKSTYADLQTTNPESPTTETIGTVLAQSRPPSVQRIEQLLDEATNPRQPGATDDMWAQLLAVNEDLRRELPTASIMDKVQHAIAASERPPDDRVAELVQEAETVLERVRSVHAALEDADDKSIVVIKRS